MHSRGRSPRRSEGGEGGLIEALVERLGEARVVAVSGESGAGKTTLARRLAEALGARLVHMDDYYRLPPRENHRARVEDLSRVGPDEVDLARLARDVGGLEGRVVVEGTWVLLLEVDVHVFLERTFEDSRQDRVRRGRDVIDEHTPRILAQEHRILSRLVGRADLRVDRHWRLR